MGRGVHYEAVHTYFDSFSLDFGPLSADGVECIVALCGVPFVLAEAWVVIGVNDCVFILRKWYASERIAVANPPVQKRCKNGRLFKPARDFNKELQNPSPGIGSAGGGLTLRFSNW